MLKNKTTCRFAARVARLGDENPESRQARKVRHHLQKCGDCQSLHEDAAGIIAWAGELGGLEALAAPEVPSVHQAVRAHVRSSQAPRPLAASWRALWPVVAPLAGVAVMAGFLLLSGTPQVAPVPGTDVAVADGKVIHMSSVDDARGTLLTIRDHSKAVHRVAVSNHGPEFNEASFYSVTGDLWVDPTPVPEPGQVVFYRVD